MTNKKKKNLEKTSSIYLSGHFSLATLSKLYILSYFFCTTHTHEKFVFSQKWYRMFHSFEWVIEL